MATQTIVKEEIFFTLEDPRQQNTKPKTLVTTAEVVKVSPEPPQNPQPWDYINTTIRFRNNDHQFWWDTTGRMFAKLLQHAGYHVTQQYRELFFYALYVAPELGPSPDEDGNVQRWRSPGTPDSTPIDFSWEWGLDGTGVVRYSFEPIGPYAGTALDPLNSFATESWINRLKEQGLVPGLDLEWYRHFTSSVLPNAMERKKTAKVFIEETTPKAGTVVALDVEKNGPVMKIYIYPGLKARELGISNLEMVARSIRSLPREQYLSLQVEPLLEYLFKGTEKYGLETGILPIDLLAPKDARVKIYVRAPHTSVEYLMDALTLGGTLDMSGYSKKAIDDMKDFWNIFLEGAPVVLPPDAPGRASPGFYYTVRSGKPPSPKMYLSPFSFCKSDAEVTARLRKYFETRRDEPDMLGQMSNYEKAMEDIFGSEILEKRCGSHYYLGCALQKDRLRVVTYLSPQTFDCEKDLIEARRRK